MNKARKDMLVILFVALVLRLAFSFVVADQVESEAFDDFRPKSDAGQYIGLANSILETGTYTLYGEPHSFRTPGYPFWLAFWYVISRSWFFSIAVIGSLLGAFVAGLIYIIGRKIFSRGVSFAAAMLFAAEPYGVHMAARPMTESLYVFLIVLLSLFVVLFYQSKGKRALLFIALSGLITGIAILVRPQMWPFYVFSISVVFYITSYKMIGKKNALKSAGIFLAIVVFTILPWIIRNIVVFGEADVSSQGGWNLYFYHVKRFTGSDRLFGLREEELNSFLTERLGEEGPSNIRSIIYQPIYYKEALKVILNNPVRYVFWHIKEGLIFFYDDGLRDMFRHVNASSEFSFKGASLLKVTRSPVALFVLFGTLFWMAIFLLLFIGAARGIKDSPTTRAVVIFFVLSILYVPAVAGTLAVARFRFVMTPMIFLLAAFGLERLKQKMYFLKRGNAG